VTELSKSTVVPVMSMPAAAVVETGRKRGYRNFNIKVAPDVEFDVQLARQLKKLVPDGFLWADANGGYDPACPRAAP